MKIEFDAPHGQVKEWVIDHMRDKLISMYHRYNKISRADVIFREETGNAHEKICEIAITIYGDSAFVHRGGESYEQAMRIALNDINIKIDDLVKHRKDPPDRMVSTIKV